VATIGENARMSAWVIIYAIGAAQAALLVPALWRRAANAAANRVLAAWLAVVCIDLAVKAIYLSGPSVEWFRAYRFVGLFPFVHASLFYLYVRTLVSGRPMRARDGVHLAGFAVMLVASAPFWLGSHERVAWLFAHQQANRGPGSLSWYDAFLFTYSLSYVAAAILRLHRYRRELRAQRADADRWSLRWVEALALAQLAIWCIAVLQATVRLPGIDYFLLYAVVAVWVCVTGYFSLVQTPLVVADASVAVGMDEAPTATAREAGEDPRAPAVEARLTELMSAEALYLAPALTIGQLARRSGYPEYLVSAVINRRFGATFWEWINQLRVDAVRARLDDANEAGTLLGIAYDCGFTAKSTFNSAFKRRVGRTPSEYRRAVVSAARATEASATRLPSPPG
jgi:AraC-like DNA-binding protein